MATRQKKLTNRCCLRQLLESTEAAAWPEDGEEAAQPLAQMDEGSEDCDGVRVLRSMAAATPGLSKTQDTSFLSPDACVERLEKLLPPMRDFIKEVRIRESQLSKAQLGALNGASRNSWNDMQHKLANARMASSADSGARNSRLASWKAAAASAVDRAASGQQAKV